MADALICIVLLLQQPALTDAQRAAITAASERAAEHARRALDEALKGKGGASHG